MDTIEVRTSVMLTAEEASLFLKFQKRFAFMQLLDSLGVFELKNASIEVNFNNLGEIGSIDIHKHFKT